MGALVLGAGRGAVIAFGIFLGLIALVVGITAWGLWFSRSRVVVRMKTLELTRGQLFISRILHFDASDITRAQIEQTQETEHGAWYCLELNTKVPGHRSVVIADGLLKYDADRCLAQLIKAWAFPRTWPKGMTSNRQVQEEDPLSPHKNDSVSWRIPMTLRVTFARTVNNVPALEAFIG